jgi:hypothetical protein
MSDRPKCGVRRWGLVCDLVKGHKGNHRCYVDQRDEVLFWPGREQRVAHYIAELEKEMFPHQESEEEQEAFTPVGRKRVARVLRRMYDELVGA